MTQIPGPGTATPVDPWKSFRGVMAGTLILEMITVLLALPVVGSVGGGLTMWSTGYLIGFAILLLLLAGLQRRPWAIWANLGVQVILVAGFFIYPAIGFMGVLFAVVWGVIASAPRCCAGSGWACYRARNRRRPEQVRCAP